jgi:hypothetical protein
VEEFRDPVEILEHAKTYLVNTRGEERAKTSAAWNELERCIYEIKMRCIDDLIGESAKAHGVRCDCPRHPPVPAALQLTPPETAKRRPVRDFKMAAAGEKEE